MNMLAILLFFITIGGFYLSDFLYNKNKSESDKKKNSLGPYEIIIILIFIWITYAIVVNRIGSFRDMINNKKLTVKSAMIKKLKTTSINVNYDSIRIYSVGNKKSNNNKFSEDFVVKIHVEDSIKVKVSYKYLDYDIKKLKIIEIDTIE